MGTESIKQPISQLGKGKRKIPQKHQKVLKKTLSNSREYVKLYCEHSSIHGFAYLVKAGLMLLEKFIWFFIMVVCLYFCITIGLQSLEKYRNKSTVIAVERDYYTWKTTLPGFTICPFSRLDMRKLKKYSEEHAIPGAEQMHFYNFLHSLANSTYINIEQIQGSPAIDALLDRLRIKPENYMDLIYNMTTDITQELDEDGRLQCSDGRVPIRVRQVLTEFGLCYTCNTKLSSKYSSSYFLYEEYPDVRLVDKRMVDYVVGTYFEKSMDISIKGLKMDNLAFYIHSAYDTMKIDQRYYYIDDGMYFSTESTEFASDKGFQSASTVAQRKCRFQDENNLEHFPLYTRHLCIQECRMRLVFHYCHCLPHFYPNRGPNAKPVCDYKVLMECIPEHKDYFIRLYSNDEDDNHDFTICDCMKNCEDAEIIVTTSTYNKGYKLLASMSLMTEIQMATWPQFRYVRRVIFTFTDLLVNIGGTAGLFLGFSVLGFVELVYFYTIRLVFQIFGYRI